MASEQPLYDFEQLFCSDGVYEEIHRCKRCYVILTDEKDIEEGACHQHLNV